MAKTSTGHFYLNRDEWNCFFALFYIALAFEHAEKKLNININKNNKCNYIDYEKKAVID
jgi:hypothetical protein